ncbi:MAG: NFACT family protein [Candidatus Altarchaeaceae archaeon]
MEKTCQYDFFVMSNYLNKEISNGRIEKIYEIEGKEKYVFKFKIYAKEKKELIFTNEAIAIFKDEKIELNPPLNPPSFVMLLRKYLENKFIQNVKQINFDKILCIETRENLLYLEFFSDGNVILCDKENKILGALIEREWKGRKIYKKEIYKPPDLKFDEKIFFGRYYEKIKGMKFEECIENLKTEELNIINILKDLLIKGIEELKKDEEDKILKELKKLEYVEKIQRERIEELKEEIKRNYEIGNKIYENFNILNEILQNVRNNIPDKRVKRREGNIIFVEI